MPTYSVTGVNVGTFNLGEADKVLTIFTAERGLIRAVAKGARKPGSKIAGRAELLTVNNLLVATGRSLDIITQAEALETFSRLRHDLVRLSYGLYYAELTQCFGQGLAEESGVYFDYLLDAVKRQAEGAIDPALLSLRFELGLLEMLGYKPELGFCVVCRQVLADANLAAFHKDWGGIICKPCLSRARGEAARGGGEDGIDVSAVRQAREITPMVWRHLVLAAGDRDPSEALAGQTLSPALKQSLLAARRIVQGYIEHRAGRRMKALDLLS